MKVGSLVELIDDNWNLIQQKFHFDNGAVYPVKNKIYTVRIVPIHETGLVLDEIVNPVLSHIDGKGEPAFRIDRFRELMPPMEISVDELIRETV